MKKLNILLVKPFQITNEVQPPLGLGYISSTVREHNVTILDCIKNGWKADKFKDYLVGKRFDIIGLQCYTVDLNTVKEFSRIVKELMPNAIVVVGGPQATLDPTGTLNYLKDVDYVFIGEAEISFPKFVSMIANSMEKRIKSVPGIAYRAGNKIHKTDRVFPENLDDFDPSWDLYDLKSYPLAPHGAFCKQYPTAPLIITRGCPFQCTYCGGSVISGRKIRSHSVDYAISQIEFLVKNYGIREIHIEDDNFTMNRRFVEEFCKKLIKKNLGVSWACPNGVRIDTLDPKLLKLMKKSGLYSISVGVESGVDRIRKLMKKNLMSETIEKKANMIHDQGLEIIGFFILGYPGETIADINATIDFACKLPLKRAGFSAYKPFPGTEAYNDLVRQGKIKKLDWDKFSLDKIVWTPDGISERQLKNLRRKAFLRFYLRPHIMLKMLSEIKNLENLKFVLLRIYRWLA
ncbi:MAG: radical SAM protein [Candidatus Aenigmatarchaeota archaeon]